MNHSLAVLLVALAAGVLTQPADGAQRVQHHRVRAVRQPQIACTVIGCVPVPRGCVPVEGRTPGGIPTGFDVIVCPRGVPVR